MNNSHVFFDNYQAKYKSALLLSFTKGLNCARMNVRGVVKKVDRFIQKPEFLLKIVQLVIAVFSVFPFFDSYFKTPKLWSKDVKNMSNFLKGIKSVDGVLNFKFAIKPIILNISGLTLFLVSGLSLIDRFKLLNISAAKSLFSAMPIFGKLPFGGLLPFSLIGLMGMTSLLSIDKLKGFKKAKSHIANEKIVQWKASLQLPQIQKRQMDYLSKIDILKKETLNFKRLIAEGEQKEKKFALRSKSLYTCQKALDEIRSIHQKKQIELNKYEKKLSEWNDLESGFTIFPKKLKDYQERKLAKWKRKLSLVKTKKTMTGLMIANNAIVLLRQIAAVVSVAAGYGLFNPGLLINAGLDATVAGLGIATYLINKR